MMTMIDELARENLIPDGLIDFTVPVIDNFGDMGVSLSLALEILSQYPNLKIRFFSEDENLFKKLIGRDHPLMRSWHQEYRIGERLSYHTLSEYSKIA